MSKWNRHAEADCGYVEVLTADCNGAVIGYRLVGARPGPQVAVAGTCVTAEKVFDRLLSIPTLPWMRGQLMLIRLDVLDGMLGDPRSLSPLGAIDRTIILPWAAPGTMDDQMVRRAYHMVLRTCADLGMISGRGVARNRMETPMDDIALGPNA